MIKFNVVLVEPEHPHNVGFAARAMRCYALSDLKIVYPKRRAVLARSYHTAPHAKEILDNAKIFHSLKEALQNSQMGIAFSRRVFDTSVPHIPLKNLPEKLPASGTIDLVFGRESRGLKLEELNDCAYQCEIPCPGQISLNLAQAVSIACYELHRSGVLENGDGLHPRKNEIKPEQATISQIESFKKFLELYASDRFQKKSFRDDFLQTILQRLHPTRNELSALYGLIRNITGKVARKEKKEF